MRTCKWLMVPSICAAVTLAGCSSSGATHAGGGRPATGKIVRIAFFEPVENGFTEAVLAGSRQAATANGGVVTDFTANGSVTTQEAQIQDAVTSGKYNALVIYPLSPAVAPTVEDAIHSGMKVATVDAPITANPLRTGALPGEIISTTEPLADRANGLAEMIIQACGDRDPCDVAYLYGIMQNPDDTAIFDAMKAALTAHPSIRIVATGQGMFAAATARAAANDILVAHADINIFVANDDDMTLGVQEAAQSAGKTGIKLIGVGASTLGCQKVRSGQWFGTTDSVPRTAGYEGALAVIKAARGVRSGLPQIWAPLEHAHLPIAITAANARACPAQWSG